VQRHGNGASVYVCFGRPSKRGIISNFPTPFINFLVRQHEQHPSTSLSNQTWKSEAASTFWGYFDTFRIWVAAIGIVLVDETWDVASLNVRGSWQPCQKCHNGLVIQQHQTSAWCTTCAWDYDPLMTLRGAAHKRRCSHGVITIFPSLFSSSSSRSFISSQVPSGQGSLFIPVILDHFLDLLYFISL